MLTVCRKTHSQPHRAVQSTAPTHDGSHLISQALLERQRGALACRRLAAAACTAAGTAGGGFAAAAAAGCLCSSGAAALGGTLQADSVYGTDSVSHNGPLADSAGTACFTQQPELPQNMHCTQSQMAPQNPTHHSNTQAYLFAIAIAAAVAADCSLTAGVAACLPPPTTPTTTVCTAAAAAAGVFKVLWAECALVL